MPIINGQKMACAPCIRGHRSTKCNHFNERVMVPVRKPGRPLSTCPCPPGKPCACGGLKVAIPRKQKCGCGPETGSDLGSIQEEHSHSHSPTETPTSPTKSSFRVTKTAPGPRTNGRKQSFDPANLSRVDPMSYNLIPVSASLDATTMTMVSNPVVAHVPPPGLPPGFETAIPFSPGSAPAFSPQAMVYGTPLPYDMNLQFPPPHTGPIQEIKTEDALSPTQAAHPAVAMPPPPYTNGSKHSRSSSTNGSGHLPVLDSSPIAKTNGASGIGGGSCCGGNKEPNGVSPVQGDFVAQFQTPMDMKQPGIETSFQYQTIFTYPAHYGSWQHPINPEMWQQIASQPGISVDNPLPTTPANGSPAGLGTSHECGCGEGCQCVGCLAHPFNDQMFQYVNNAYTESNGSRGASRGSCCGGGDAGAETTPTQAPGPESPPEAHTPSDGSGEEQSLPMDQYFFVDLPIGMNGLCGGDIQLCPCGDDCQCLGCTVHNVPPLVTTQPDYNQDSV
ncbi:hypothetical protein QBC34DRAFT_177496 [Podospora aff. communis PSN243]|uniref:Copper-fist domain-containing protein n=1 Tax=Podospora aff. communis PSN243 TaxID=3040156 RepID=A0AAV9H033_9PEZI|nr:hypothetical protein QBC34DRAFT_177496 [Podospora aff. communis PSN243]